MSADDRVYRRVVLTRTITETVVLEGVHADQVDPKPEGITKITKILEHPGFIESNMLPVTRKTEKWEVVETDPPQPRLAKSKR